METASLKELLFLVLADIFHKITKAEALWKDSACTKLGPTRSESNEILDINVL